MKRFTATEKWEKPWFQDLPPHLKCMWLYICDKADCAGVWEINWKAASLFIGKNVSASDLSAFGERTQMLQPGKLWLVGFIAFQYGKLSNACRPHIPIFAVIKKHGLLYTEDHEVLARTQVGHVSEGKRILIFERDGGKCVYCGNAQRLEPDHIVARMRGGSDEISNLVTACHDCNTKKAERPVADFLSAHPDKDRVLEYLDRVFNTLPRRVKDKEQEEEEEREQDKDKETEEEEAAPKAEIASNTDDAAILEFEKLDAYRGVDVRREFGKMRGWLTLPANSNRQLTRRFAMNWLNKCDPRLEPGANGHKPKEPGPLEKKYGF